jgi:hypothetical protein
MAFDARQIPEELIAHLKSDNCSLFVGAGLSIASGLPTWKSMLNELIKELGKLPFDTASKQEDYLRMMADSNKYLMVAEDLKSTLAKYFYEYLERRFGDAKLNPNKNHEMITSINFQFIITTNYDKLIEKAYAFNRNLFPAVLTNTSSRDIAYKIWNKEFFIVKAHGDVTIRKDEIVMTEKDYREIMFKNPGFQSALQVMFSTKSMLFVGTSFTDPDFLLLMRYLHSAYHGGGPTHYILIDSKDVLNVESKRYMEDFNLHTIKYSNAKGNFEEITDFLTALSAAAPAK